MNTLYGDIPNKNISQYFKYLVGKVFKILPLYEEHSMTLTSYIRSFQRELIGSSILFKELENEPKFITLLNTVEYLSTCDYDHDVCKSEVLKCTHIINDINRKYFEGSDSDV